MWWMCVSLATIIPLEHVTDTIKGVVEIAAGNIVVAMVTTFPIVMVVVGVTATSFIA